MTIIENAQAVKTEPQDSAAAEPRQDATHAETLVAVVQQAILKMAKEAERKAKRQEAKPATAAPAKSEAPPSIDARYSNSLRASPDYAIGGRGITGLVNTTMYRWEESHWKALCTEEENQAFQSWVREIDPSKEDSYTASRATKTAVANLLGDAKHDLSKMTTDQPIIPTPDGYLRIESDGTIRVTPCERSLGMTYCVNARLAHDRVRNGIYTPAPVPPNSAFGGFLDYFFPQPIIPEAGTEVRDMLQEACSTILLNECFERALVFIGDGSNGKSTLISILSAMVHTEAWELGSAGDRFGNQVIATNPKLIVDAEVPSFLPDQAVQKLKSVVSGDQILIDRKHRDPVSIRPRCVVILACNKPIHTTDHSAGARRKLLQIPFNVVLDDKSPDRVRNFDRIITGSPREMSYVLDWLLEGATRLLKRGCLPQTPEAITKLSNDLRMVTDSMYGWARDIEIAVDDKARSPKDDIYEHYARQTVEDGNKAVSKNEFYRRLPSITGAYKEGQMTDRAGKRIRIVGLRIPPANIYAERLRLPRDFLAQV